MEERETLDVDFGLYPDITKSRYLDVYEGVYAEMVYAKNLMKTQDLSMTYLGQREMTRDTKIKAEERFPITGQGFASGKLLDGMECQILLDTAASKSYILKSYYFAVQDSTRIAPNFLQTHKEFKWEMDNMSAYYL